MRAMMIVNPHATATTERRRDLLAHALAAEVRLVVAQTDHRGHAAELAAKAVSGGAELIVVHGGDGTVNEVVNGIMTAGAGRDAPMIAVVPGGSTNVFARAMGIDQDPVLATEQILEALIVRQHPRTISLGRVDDRYFTFNAGMGLDAEVVAAVESRRATGRAISNALHVRKAISEYFRTDRRHPRLTLTIDGVPAPTPAHLVFVSNVDPWTYFEGRAVRTNPGTSADRGLGVFALTSLRLPTVLRVSSQLLRTDGDPSSRHLLRKDDVNSITVSCSEPVALQVDGDYLGLRTGATFTSVPGALRVLTGAPVRLHDEMSGS
ncbi:Diacylglycerol kinase family enzyme [Nakamurella panacisegetis]|uniref:Diacylglycerol kinase family enzyme n=1 Tax=Nakamurella panacisegetis TaxID=1090615 RepID=A0A1H0I5G3_9ACTN|nr:diacylglycerol kinase family protein [Nakamurella panacisegetis]SDO26410.1 Diacylglycerol kinase family enzyme [Nakamurella panacisegetis]